MVFTACRLITSTCGAETCRTRRRAARLGGPSSYARGSAEADPGDPGAPNVCGRGHLAHHPGPACGRRLEHRGAVVTRAVAAGRERLAGQRLRTGDDAGAGAAAGEHA